jgi:hypothetical protein
MLLARQVGVPAAVACPADSDLSQIDFEALGAPTLELANPTSDADPCSPDLWMPTGEVLVAGDGSVRVKVNKIESLSIKQK